MLQAAAKLPGIWQLHIAGEGPERPVLQKLAHQLNIADRVQFDGTIASGQMPHYLQQLDVLVLASRTRPTGKSSLAGCWSRRWRVKWP